MPIREDSSDHLREEEEEGVHNNCALCVHTLIIYCRLQTIDFKKTCSNNMFITNTFVGPVAQWKRIRLRIWGLQVRSLPGSSFYTINNKKEQRKKKKKKEGRKQRMFLLLLLILQWTTKRSLWINLVSFTILILIHTTQKRNKQPTNEWMKTRIPSYII